jgi:hypothetical protein
MIKKQCFKCGRYKDVDSFYQHVRMADGHLGKCKSCTKKDVNDRYYNPEFREKIKEYERKRYQTPHRKAKALQYQRQARLTFRGKNLARSAVARAIKTGKITRQPCEICGDIKSQAHHTDYRKYYEVKWLCFKHHREAHKQLID